MYCHRQRAAWRFAVVVDLPSGGFCTALFLYPRTIATRLSARLSPLLFEAEEGFALYHMFPLISAHLHCVINSGDPMLFGSTGCAGGIVLLVRMSLSGYKLKQATELEEDDGPLHCSTRIGHLGSSITVEEESDRRS